MIETNVPEIDINEIMEKIRAEVKQRKEQVNISAGTFPTANFAVPFSRHAKIELPELSSGPNPKQLEIKDHYHINDFLKYHDQQFVINAYRGILRRGPDSGAFQYFLEKLRAGKMTKAEVLGRLRYAPEGRLKKTKVQGLFWNFLIQSSFRIPVLGYFSRFGTGIGNLPLILNNMVLFQQSTITQLESQYNDLALIHTKMGEIIEALEHLDLILHGKIEVAALGTLTNEGEVAIENRENREQIQNIIDKSVRSSDKQGITN